MIFSFPKREKSVGVFRALQIFLIFKNDPFLFGANKRQAARLPDL